MFSDNYHVFWFIISYFSLMVFLIWFSRNLYYFFWYFFSNFTCCFYLLNNELSHFIYLISYWNNIFKNWIWFQQLQKTMYISVNGSEARFIALFYVKAYQSQCPFEWLYTIFQILEILLVVVAGVLNVSFFQILNKF